MRSLITIFFVLIQFSSFESLANESLSLPNRAVIKLESKYFNQSDALSGYEPMYNFKNWTGRGKSEFLTFPGNGENDKNNPRLIYDPKKFLDDKKNNPRLHVNSIGCVSSSRNFNASESGVGDLMAALAKANSCSEEEAMAYEYLTGTKGEKYKGNYGIVCSKDNLRKILEELND